MSAIAILRFVKHAFGAQVIFCPNQVRKMFSIRFWFALTVKPYPHLFH